MSIFNSFLENFGLFIFIVIIFFFVFDIYRKEFETKEKELKEKQYSNPNDLEVLVAKEKDVFYKKYKKLLNITLLFSLLLLIMVNYVDRQAVAKKEQEKVLAIEQKIEEQYDLVVMKFADYTKDFVAMPYNKVPSFDFDWSSHVYQIDKDDILKSIKFSLVDSKSNKILKTTEHIYLE